MATVDLTTDQYRHLVRLLAESAGILTVEQRQSLLDLAGLAPFRTRLQFDTDARSFAAQLVRELQAHGTYQQSGQPALVALLVLVREVVAGNEPEAAFLDSLLAPYGRAVGEGGAAIVPGAVASSPVAPTVIQYYQTIYNSGGGAVAQGPGATALGAGAVSVGGNAERSQIVTGKDNTVAGGDAPSGSIRVGKIEGAERVTIGTAIEGALPTDALALARAFLGGAISVEEVLGSKDVTVGLRYVTDPRQPTLAELQGEIAALRDRIEAARAAGDVPSDAAADAAGDLDSAGSEAAKAQPDGGRIVRKLKGAAEALESLDRASEASKGLAGTLGKLLPVAATLVALAKAYFGIP